MILSDESFNIAVEKLWVNIIERPIFGASLSSLEIELMIRVQILDEADCVLHRANALEKGMNLVLPQLC